MLYRIAADAVLVLHFAFVLFVLLGGLLVLRWPRVAWLHLPAVAWAAFVEFSGRICALTPLEVALRQAAGDAGYAGDFLEHYIVAVMYPEALPRSLQIALGAAVLLVCWRYGARARARAERNPMAAQHALPTFQIPNVEMTRGSPYRVAIANANVPNMLGQISAAMGKAGPNIHTW